MKILFPAQAALAWIALLCFSSNIHASALFFETVGSDLIITAREDDNSAQYWSLTLAQGGAVTGFYDLTGAPGGDAAFNIARGNLLTTTVTGGEVRLDSHANATATIPEGTDGATSFTFSVATTFPDYVGGAMATFTSQITINAPTNDGTRFDIVNSLVTPANWTSGGSLTQGGRESCSGLSLMIQGMQGSFLQSYNGWEEIPKESIQWVRFTADNSPGYADGRSFYLAQTADLAADSIGTNVNYQNLAMSENLAILTQMLSGVFRGNAPADSTFGSTGSLEINIATAP